MGRRRRKLDEVNESGFGRGIEGELTMPMRTKTGIFDNEASAVDLKVYDALKDLKWTPGDTLLYATCRLG